MATFESNGFQCRANRSVRLYHSVYDAKDCSKVLPSGAIFTSKKQYIRNHVTMYHVTESDNPNVPVGYWCSSAVIQLIPIALPPEKEPVITDEGYTAVDTELVVKASGVVVYKYASGDAIIPCDMKLGDKITSDQQNTVMVHGNSETRYRIAVFSGEDTSLTGGWIAGNRAVKELVPEPEVAVFDAPMAYAAVPSVGGGGGGSNTAGNPATSTTPTNNDAGGTNVPLPNKPDSNGTDVSIDKSDPTKEIVITTENYNSSAFMEKLYAQYGMDYFGSTEASLMGTPIGRMLFVHGMPFQFTHITDRRGGSRSAKGMSDCEWCVDSKASGGSSDMYGRTFAKEIAGNMPIAVLVPGKPKFLTNVQSGLFRGSSASEGEVAGWLPAFGASDTELGAALSAAFSNENLQGDYQYYSLEVSLPDFFEYVDTMAHSAARLMGIGNMTYMGVPLESFHWADYNKDTSQEYGMFQEVVGLTGGVSFAYDPTGAVSDQITNSTGESKFASFFNNINSQAREIEFILGYSGADAYKLIDSANFVGESQNAMRGGLFGGLESVIDRVGTWLQNSLHGMNMRFPEIWNESQHNRGYDIEMHFITPYATAFCKYRYVLIPFFHIFCLVAPKSDSNVSQYSSPFLIRAYSKGYFNVEMGIIESLQWKRFGDGDMISDDGIPTQIDVSIQFKDLYHTLAMTNMYKNGNNVQNFMNNTGLVDLIGTLSGVNMNRIALKDRLAMWASSSFDAWGSAGGNFMRHIQGRVRDVVENIMYGI